MSGLESVKAGDSVAVVEGYHYTTTRIEKVVKVTPQQVVLSGDRRFYKSTGLKVGWMSVPIQIVAVTDEIRASVEAEEIRAQMTDVAWRKVKLSDLRAIKAILVDAGLLT